MRGESLLRRALSNAFDALATRFELSRGGQGNVHAMEGLRGFAVLLVFFVHYVSATEAALAPQSATAMVARALHAVGNTGVDLFFVLSGFLIYGSLMERPQRFTRFMRRRVQRIYPAFLAVFAAYVALSWIFPAESRIPADAWEATLYLVENILLLPGLFPIVPFITVAWSLSYEMFFYLAIPLFIAIVRLRGRSSRWRMTLFVLLVVAFACSCLFFGGPIRLIMFGAGMLLFEAIENRGMRGPPATVAIAVLLCSFALVAGPRFVNTAVVPALALFVSYGLLCMTCFTRPESWLVRAASYTPLRWLGNMSYSFYLLHGLALKALFLFVIPVSRWTGHGPLFFWLFLAPAFMAAAVASAVLFLLIERPFSLVAGQRTRTETAGATEALPAGSKAGSPPVARAKG